MNKNNIFYKKTNYKHFYIFFLLILILLCSYIFFKENKFIYIPSFEGSFYIIPEDKGGKKIANQNKKGLHLSNLKYKNLNFINDPMLQYSIQLFTHNEYDFIKNKREKLLSNIDNIFLPSELFIIVFETNIGSEYILSYKNFNTRLKAYNYCDKYGYFLDSCVIVNVQNL